MDPRSERIQKKFEWPVVVAALLTIPILVIQESHLGQPWWPDSLKSVRPV
jgi:hypothetical protein